MIHLTIDNLEVEVQEGTTVLQAARAAGLEIPTLCDHPALEPYGGCRLCVVEIQGWRTLQASCTLPAMDGMVVYTNTPKLRQAREFILTMIFSERNHFCMVCQKTDGDCELQNAAYGEGMTHWSIQPQWTPNWVDATNPYFVFDHNRCILCRRCVRACGDLVGNHTLTVENRGAKSMVTADYGVAIGLSSCVSCGACVQVCPTGALIDRSSAYLGQEKNVDHFRSVCAGCSIGCGVDLVVRDNNLIRIDGDWEAPVNEGLLCEQGRYQPVTDQRERVTQPLVRKNGALEPATWNEALERIASQLKPSVNGNTHEAAALVSTRLPAEALYAFKQIFSEGLHCSSVASIEEDFTTNYLNEERLDGNLESVKTADLVFAIGVDLMRSHQVAGFFVKRNQPDGTCLVVIDPRDSGMAENANFLLQPAPGTDAELLRGIQAGIISLGLNKNSVLPDGQVASSAEDLVKISQATGIQTELILEVARQVALAQRPVFVYGKGLIQNGSKPAFSELRNLADLVGKAPLVNIKGKANSLAAHIYGLNRRFDAGNSQAVYLALGDDYPTARLMERLEQAAFVAVQASFVSELVERADVILPVETWAEQEGHYLNLEGRLQAAHRALSAPDQVRSNLSVLRSLADHLHLRINDQWKEEILSFHNIIGN